MRTIELNTEDRQIQHQKEYRPNLVPKTYIIGTLHAHKMPQIIALRTLAGFACPENASNCSDLEAACCIYNIFCILRLKLVLCVTVQCWARRVWFPGLSFQLRITRCGNFRGSEREFDSKIRWELDWKWVALRTEMDIKTHSYFLVWTGIKKSFRFSP